MSWAALGRDRVLFVVLSVILLALLFPVSFVIFFVVLFAIHAAVSFETSIFAALSQTLARGNASLGANQRSGLPRDPSATPGNSNKITSEITKKRPNKTTKKITNKTREPELTTPAAPRPSWLRPFSSSY